MSCHFLISILNMQKNIWRKWKIIQIQLTQKNPSMRFIWNVTFIIIREDADIRKNNVNERKSKIIALVFDIDEQMIGTREWIEKVTVDTTDGSNGTNEQTSTPRWICFQIQIITGSNRCFAVQINVCSAYFNTSLYNFARSHIHKYSMVAPIIMQLVWIFLFNKTTKVLTRSRKLILKSFFPEY